MSRFFLLAFLLISMHAHGQITGNLRVKDNNAVPLDQAALNKLAGKWKLLRTEEYLRGQTTSQERGMLFEFGREGSLHASWCVGCYQELVAKWEVLDERVLNLRELEHQKELERRENSSFLAGSWAVYKLSDDALILAKVLTSNGDWKKIHYFSRQLGTQPASATERHCMNCSNDGRWCWGDQPEASKQQWAALNSLLNEPENYHSKSAEIVQSVDWLLQHAPCVSEHLYIKAADYYQKLLNAQLQAAVRDSLAQKLEKVKAQQKIYFK